MKIEYDIPKLKEILNDLFVLTGIRMGFVDNECRSFFSVDGKTDFCMVLQRMDGFASKCQCSDSDIIKKCAESRKFESHICHAGLWDAAMPLIKREVIVGYLIMGRIRSAKTVPVQTYRFGADDGALAELYGRLPYLTEEQIESLKRLLPNILFESAIKMESESLTDCISEFIDNNLSEKLSVEKLCLTFHISKSSLYDAFHKAYGCAVNEYILSRRLQSSQALLTETPAPVYRIAETVGMQNYTYFCKIFKRKVGISPTAYRKEYGTN